MSKNLKFVSITLNNNLTIRLDTEKWTYLTRDLFGRKPEKWLQHIVLDDLQPAQDFAFVKITEHVIAKSVVKGWQGELLRFVEHLSQMPHCLFLHENILAKGFDLCARRRVERLQLHEGRSGRPFWVDDRGLQRDLDEDRFTDVLDYVEGEVTERTLLKLYYARRAEAQDVGQQLGYDPFEEGTPVGSPRVRFVPCYLDTVLRHVPTSQTVDAALDPVIQQAVSEMCALTESLLTVPGVRLAPYRFNYQIEEVVGAYLDDPESHLDQLRLFVPANLATKLQAERLLDLIRSYCSGIGLSDVSVHKRETASGIHFGFRFHSGPATLAKLDGILSEFHRLVDIAAFAPEVAKAGLVAAGIAEVKADELVTLITTEWPRIQLDLEFAQKRRVLDLEKKARERIIGGTSITLPDEDREAISSRLAAGIVSLVNPGTVNIYIGKSERDPEVKRLQDLIDSNSEGSERAALSADLETIIDSEVPRAEKLSSYQRLKRFWERTSKAVEGFTAEVIARYIDLKMG
ncbi:MAG: hypothetical protein WAO58_03300 [Fimbriimonadaceae bacterium]